jgi:GT2 family glycosyltransferase
MTKSNISIIIAHLNQPDFLRTCLSALHLQTHVLANVEIIVVDNGSVALPTDVILGFADVKLETEATPGPGPARNKGVAVAKGDILAFIDADCVADPLWLATISQALRPESSMSIIGGRVRVGTAVAGHPNMVEAYEQVFSFRQQYYIEKVGFSGTGNLAMRRDIFDQVGPFGGIELAEDKDWGQRAAKLGLKTHYIPAMCVTHPARKSLDEIYAKLDRVLSHDYASQSRGAMGQLKWFAKAVAVAVSPLISSTMILRSPDVETWRSRLLAACGLVFVRLYRTRKMLALQFGFGSGRGSQSWNRE